MTRFITDVSRWQVERTNPLDLALARTAGITTVNIALNRYGPQGNAWARRYADEARAAGMGVSTYWYLTGEDGADQAARAWQRILDLGGPDGMAHQCDCEASATRPVWTAYVDTLQQLLGRHVAAYTGDWWWTAPGRNWPGGELTPFLWAAPNAGYLTAYPGDDSPHWRAGYGGWPELAVMQYQVAPLPGTGDCSLSAIRTDAVWAALTGGSPTVTVAPADLRTVQAYVKTKTGLPWASLGIVGDANHNGGYHHGKGNLTPTDYSVDESPRDANPTPSASGFDLGGAFPRFREITMGIVRACERGDPRARDIREVIYTPDGVTVKRFDRLRVRSSGDKSHLTHTHIGFFRDSEGRRDDPDNFLGLIQELFDGTGKDELMGATEDVRALYVAAFDGGGAGTNPADDVDGVVPAEHRTSRDRVGNAWGSQLNFAVGALQTLLARAGGLSDADLAAIADAVADRLVEGDDTPGTPTDRDAIRSAVEDVVGRLELTVRTP